VPERRRSLTPLESELRPRSEPADERAGPYERWRARRERRPPTTTRSVVARGLLRLGIAVGAACGIGLLLDYLTGRGGSFGFYVVGAALFTIAFFTSASPMGSRTQYSTASRDDREQRVRWSFAYILAGVVLVLIGVAIDLI
jgi:hypothetical protein